ncbi:MAG TPA: T9SS type A sorting domain-containing protein [Parafilimonas sp.]|nr:T9SS type A sorting domain-containing protein [Parafilimonas sp.]
MKTVIFLRKTGIIIILFSCGTYNSQSQSWSSVGGGLNKWALCLTAFNNQLYVGGGFTTAGGSVANYIAAWNGLQWSSLGSGMNSQVEVIGVFNNNIYAGGSFTTAGGVSVSSIAKWDGANWAALGKGIHGGVYAITEYNGYLYVGGTFDSAGTIAANNIAKWDGSNWSSVGNGLNSYVNTLSVIDGLLYVGGGFSKAGGITAKSIAKWDGNIWSSLGSGTNGSVGSIQKFNGDIYIGGSFTNAGGLSANNIAKWNGSSWASLISEPNNLVTDLKVFGSSLYVCGLFSQVGSVYGNIVKWDGNNWSSVGYADGNAANCLELFNSNLFLGGDFYSVGGTPANNIAVYSNSIATVQPKIYTSNSSLNSGQIQTITGSNFTNNGTINLYVQNSNGDLISTNNSFTYLSNGGFTYQLPITSDMPGGEYTVYAIDAITGVSTPTIKFLVNNTTQQKLWINEPTGSSKYETDNPVIITWGDFITNSNVTGKSGLITKHYKIEYSSDNGATWNTISNSVQENATSNQSNSFTSSYSFSNAGNTYKIRVTDIDNPSNYNIGATFKITASSSIGGYTSSLEWDKSSPVPFNVSHPYGLAADGTARVLIKFARSAGNKKSVKAISAQILPSGNDQTSSGTSLLGKITLATNINQYSLEGNYANNTSASVNYAVPDASQSFYFWLVAPDDFINVQSNQDLENQTGQRTIKVAFNITYNDNTKEKDTVKNIQIVRPPLMMVHGLNGDATSFDNAKYNFGWSSPKYFKQSQQNGLVKVYDQIELIKYASFDDNAQVLLSEGGPNSFQKLLGEMHSAGYASNRVDYVCHSMGGCVARTVISYYGSKYVPSIQDTNLYKFRNYGSGFINKLITINTPHNGSELADWVYDKYKYGITPLNPLDIAAYDFFGFETYFHQFDGYFVETSPTRYDVSPAILDLRAYSGGIHLPTTYVKNHLIGSDVDYANNQSETNLLSNENLEIYGLYKVLLGLKIFTSVHDYYADNYGTDEYLSNSDLIVPISSQLPEKTINQIPNVKDNPFVESNSSILYGPDVLPVNHLDIKDNVDVGNRVMVLLNAPINSSYFADEIPANQNLVNRNQVANFSDSSFSYFDKKHIKIQSPLNNATKYVDSSLAITIKVKDTSHLQQIEIFFQGQSYRSNSKDSLQTFNVQVGSNSIGKDKIIAEAIYDSAGFSVSHVDTVNIHVNSLDTLKGFYITPKSINLNPKQTFIPEYNAIFSHYVGLINNDNSSLQFKIGDTHVIKYVDSLHEFIAKDTGTTYIICKYKGFADTGFIYITNSQSGGSSKVLPGYTITEKIIKVGDNEGLKVYPNPSKGIFAIDLNTMTNIQTLKIVDYNSKEVYSNYRVSKTTTLQIDLSKYAAGVYFIEASDGKKTYSKKVIIEK